MRRLLWAINSGSLARERVFRPALESLEPRTVPAFLSPAGYEGGPFAGEAVITELNGDGIPDIVEGFMLQEPAFTGYIRVLLGNDDGTGCGTGSFTQGGVFNTSKGTLRVAAGDLNSDGNIDVVTVDYFVGFSVLFGNGDGTFAFGMTYTGDTQGSGIALGDLDNDGDLDLARAISSTLEIRINDGLGNFGPKTSYAVGFGPNGVKTGDVDNDGDVDVTIDSVSSSGDGGLVSVLRNNGDGTLQPAANYLVSGGPRGHALSDMDKDGDLDIATGNHVSDTVSILRNTGTGRFRSKVDFPSGDQPVFPVADDFDADGNLDLATGSFSQAGSVHLLLGNGNLTFEPPSDYPAGGNAQSLMSGDLNCDDYPDLVLATGTTGLVVVLLNDAIWGPAPSTTPLRQSSPPFFSLAWSNPGARFFVGHGNHIENSYIGTGVGGTLPVPNAFGGIRIVDGFAKHHRAGVVIYPWAKGAAAVAEPHVDLAGPFECDGDIEAAVAV